MITERMARQLAATGAALVLIYLSSTSAVRGQAVGSKETPDLQRPGVLANVNFEQKPGAQIPKDLVFRDSENNEVRLGDLLGDRPVILNLVYFECPLLCDQVLDGLVRSLNVLENTLVSREFDVLTISINPKETPQTAREKKTFALRSYRYSDEETPQGWHFLTAESKETIDTLTSAVGFSYYYNPKSELYAHPAGIMVATPEGVLSRYIYGVSYPARDLRLALSEASEGVVGGVYEQFLLLCYAYDPESGTYSFAIMTVVKYLAFLTVFSLGLYIALMLRNERRVASVADDGIPPQSIT